MVIEWFYRGIRKGSEVKEYSKVRPALYEICHFDPQKGFPSVQLNYETLLANWTSAHRACLD